MLFHSLLYWNYIHAEEKQFLQHQGASLDGEGTCEELLKSSEGSAVVDWQ